MSALRTTDERRVLNRLEEEESLELEPYMCPAEVLTIAAGVTFPLTPEEARVLTKLRFRSIWSEAEEKWPWLYDAPDGVQRAMADLVYNLGVPRLSGFVRTLRLLQTGDYELAAEELLDSKYAREDVPARANRNADLIRRSA